MAAITTQANGFWDVSGTWTGGTIPGNGDTVTLNHTVTVRDSRIVGVSPAAGAGTPAMQINAAFTITAAGTLTCRGDVQLSGVTFTNSGIFEFDAHLAGVPATALYIFQIGHFPSDAAAILIPSGSSGAHCVFRSNAGGAHGRFTNNGNDHSGQVQGSWGDFQSIGDASNPAIAPLLGNGDTFSLTDCTFDSSCGSIGNNATSGGNNDCNIALLRVTMDGATGGIAYQIPIGAPTTGTRSMKFCYMTNFVDFGHIENWVIEDSTLAVLYTYIGSGTWTSFLRVFLATTDPLAIVEFSGVVTDCYYIRVGNQNNPHFFDTVNASSRVTGTVFECPDGTDGSGDCVAHNGGVLPGSDRIDHCIVLDDGADHDSGTMSTCLGDANTRVTIEHNTYHGGQGAYFGESFAGVAGMGIVRNNISWARSAGTAYIIKADPGVIANVVQGADAHHNGRFNAHATNGYDPNLTFSPATQGSGDVSGDPQFVDVNRGVKKWSTSLGGAGTTLDAMARIKAGTATIAQLLTYVKAGFAPQNAAYHAASDNISPSNGWIGAVAGASGGGADIHHHYSGV